jgi:hypothetical protein
VPPGHREQPAPVGFGDQLTLAVVCLNQGQIWVDEHLRSPSDPFRCVASILGW